MPTYFHIAGKDHGPKFVMTPKLPDSAHGSNECQETNRVCFAPSIEQCIVSVLGAGKSTDVFEAITGLYYVANRSAARGRVKKSIVLNPPVYATTKKLTPPKKTRGTDMKLTGEMWSLTEIEVTRKGYIDLHHLTRTGYVRLTMNNVSKVTLPEIETIRGVRRFGTKKLLSRT